MKGMTKNLITIVLSLVIVSSLAYINRLSLMTWAAAQGAMGYLATLAEPILPSQPVNWDKPAYKRDTNLDRPPNIIVILADDLGWNDISFYGGGVGKGAVQTPNIDRIAAEGVHFSNGYAGNATCAPSRAHQPT